MELTCYETIVKSEDKAFRYLSKKCRENGHRFCPKCTCRVLWKLGSGRRRRSRCRCTFTDFSGRWLNQSRLSCQNWLRVLKLFELEVSTNKIASQLAAPYNTVHRAVMLIRHAELEFRYNHRHDDIFELMADTVCSLTPNIEKSFRISGE